MVAKSSMSQRFELTVTSQAENLARIADFVREAAQAAGLDMRQTFQVRLAVDEACTNIMEHAYGPDRIGPIACTCQVCGDDFVVTLNDQGQPFDPAQVPVPDVEAALKDRPLGGLGIFLMRKLMDAVTFSHDPQTGNELVMVKKISRRQE